MSRSRSKQENSKRRKQPRVDLPDWITDELIQQTLKIWQPYYSDRLTDDDAIVIIKNVGVLFECLRRET